MKKLTTMFFVKGGALLMLAALLFAGASALFAAPAPPSPRGADAIPDLYSPDLAGSGGFSTSTGGAPVSAINPAQGADARRIIFDLGYLAIPDLSGGPGYMQSAEAGALFPTKSGVFGGSLRFIGGSDEDLFTNFPIRPTFAGNAFASKEILPGMSVGAGLNFGFGSGYTIALDLGFRNNIGKLGPLQNFTWAIVLRDLGWSYYPTWLTAMGGISFDALQIKGKDGKKDPFALNIASDLIFPSLFYFHKDNKDCINMIWKLGIKMTVAEIINISTSWPGGSGLNIREFYEPPRFSWIPSVGIGVDIRLPSGGKQFAGGKLPSDGDLKVDLAYKPLYEDIAAIGGGVSWYVGIPDKKPPVIKVEYDEPKYFSPNHDGLADFIEFPVNITDDNYVVSWAMTVEDTQGNIVRTIENKDQRPQINGIKDFFGRLFSVKKQVEIPPTLAWDGFRDEGGIAPDGNYTFTVSSTDDSGNTGFTQAYKVVLKNTPPEIAIQQLSGTQLIFNPMGGDKPSITLTPSGSAEDSWESGIWNAAGEKIRSFESYSGQPKPQVWNGRNDAGEVAQDGVYSYQISTTDRAKNSASATLNNIILDGRVAGVFLTSSAAYIAPKPNQSTSLVDFAVRLSLTEGIQSWKLELKDQGGAARRTFTGTGRTVPASIGWNGLDDAGVIREGAFVPELTVSYTRGDEVRTTATAVIVDVSGPELTLKTTPDYFSPDNDGVDDELNIELSAKDVSPIASWSLQIRDPESNAEFYRIEGRGNPSAKLVWNGRSNKGELVQSATDYPYTFKVDDILGNSSSLDGKVGVDVLVIKDGDRLRIQIPSIVFRPNFADFVGLSDDVVENNSRILKRIAGILNKFRDYKVQVEGHANPTTPPGPARDREEAELKTISENRAKKVVDELVRYGVARSRLYYIGVGGTRTLVPYDDLDNRWKNRRVEFILIK